MSAIAIFTCRPNSHPFQDRHVSLHESVKIGRAVARARPSPQNAIFDCKVLSRNHALLWYENGNFLLQDTKSSNGTFVNNQRLSKGTEESPPTEIFSGDIIQFGVDVMENSRRVTHSCIIAAVQLFHPDGTEANNLGNVSLIQGAANAVQPQELYQLTQYLQEAVHREQMLEQKLTTLQEVLANTQEATEGSWQALIDEDRLLSRLELLDSQLQVYSKNHSEDSLRQELVTLKEEKSRYESTVKESLRRMLDEKMEATEKATELEQSLKSSEEECRHLKEMCEDTQKELLTLAEQHQQQVTEFTKLQTEFKDAETSHATELQSVINEKLELQQKIDDLQRLQDSLQAKVEELTANNEFSKEQLNNLKARMESFKSSNKSSDSICIPETSSRSVQVEMVNLLDLQALHGQSDDSEKEDDSNEMDSKVKETLDILDQLDEDMASQENLSTEDLLGTSCASDLVQYPIDSSTESPTVSPDKLKHTKSAVTHYRELLKKAEDKLEDYRNQIKELEDKTADMRLNTSATSEQVQLLAEKLEHSDDQLHTIIDKSLASLQEHLNESMEHSEKNTSLTVQLKELLQETRQSLKSKEEEVEALKRELQDADQQITQYNEQSSNLRVQISEANSQLLDKNSNVEHLRDQLQKAELATKDVKDQILLLREKLQESKSNAAIARLEAQHLREKVQMLECQLSPDSSIDESIATLPEDDFQLKEDCLRSRLKIKTLEEKIIGLERDKQNLEEYQLQLQEFREKNSLSSPKLQNLTDAQKEADHVKEQLAEANKKIVSLEEKCGSIEEELAEVLTDYKDVHAEYSQLALRSKAAASCAIIPLLVILFAIVTAFYPTLSQFTGTTEY